jgi:23S rRNA-intervening sequence protein
MSEIRGRTGKAIGPISFERLEVFKRAYRISLDIHRASLKFPDIEQRALADQIRRASKSICANLAEGFGKQSHSNAEFRRFIRNGVGICRRDANVGPVLLGPRICSRSNLDCLAKRISDHRQDAAGAASQIRHLTSDICPLSGSGAFCRRRRETCEGSWRLQKCECWHE